jgi:hypothetical protein
MGSAIFLIVALGHGWGGDILIILTVLLIQQNVDKDKKINLS